MRKDVRTCYIKECLILALLLCLQVSLLSCGGKKQPTTPPEKPPQKPPAPVEKNRYEKGDILLVTGKDYAYFAEVTAGTKLSANEVPVQFFVKDIRKTLGNKVSLKAIRGKREKPKEGWGSQKVLLQYFDGNKWVAARDVIVFEDFYLLPESVEGDRRVPLSKVRILIFD